MPVVSRALLLLASLTLAACGGDSGSGAAPTTYAVGGVVTGLTGTVGIANNGAGVLTRSDNGAFTLGNFAEGANYNVTVSSQPAGQTCTVYNGTGKVDSAVAIILVSCQVNTDAAVHALGGTVSGLSGRVVLQNNLADNLSVAANGAFTFARKMNDGGHYAVSVGTQPFGQACTVANGTGTATADVTNVAVSCTTATYTISGTVSGLGTDPATLQLNGGNNLVLAANGAFSFSTTVLHGAPWAVTVLTNPAGQECVITNGSGTAFGNVGNVSVVCGLPRHRISGTLTGLTGSVTLQNNGGDDIVFTDLVPSDVEPFSFATEIIEGNSFSVTVKTQPTGQFCAVANGSGAPTADVTNVTVTCAPTVHTVSGTITGLSGGSSVTLANNGIDGTTYTGNGTFTFTTPVTYGNAYAVTITGSTGPDACGVTHGSGTITADVSNVKVTCLLTAPGAPVPSFTRTSRPRELGITWNEVDGAQFYRVFKDPDGVSGFTQLGGDLTVNAAGDLISVHRFDWANALYKVAACNSFGCTESALLPTTGGMAQAVGYLKASNTSTGGYFGVALALSADGTTLAVGGAGEPSSGSDPADTSLPQAGAVYLFQRDGNGDWTQVARIKSPAPDLNDQFGSAVALSADGNTLAVGAPLEDGGDNTPTGSNYTDDSTSASGAVYIYTRSGGTWQPLQAYIKADNSNVEDQFGTAVALSADGNTLVVGAPLEDSAATGINGANGNNPAGENAGAAYVFVRSGSTWSQEAYIKASNTGSGDRFGITLALADDGNTLAVGAYGEASGARGVDLSGGGSPADDSQMNAGAAYVYTRSGATWTQQAYVKASNTRTGDRFGISLALSADGDTLAVGAPTEDGAATGINGDETSVAAEDAGAAYLYRRSAGVWTQQAYVKASNTEAADNFGARLALSADGSTLVASAISEDSNAAGVNGDAASNFSLDTGAAYVFDFDGSNWSQSAYVKAAVAGANDGFGYALGLSADGDTMAIGAFLEDSGAKGVNLSGGGSMLDNAKTDAGAVYLY